MNLALKHGLLLAELRWGGWRRRWCQDRCWRWFLGSAVERRGCAQDRVAQPLATSVLSLPVKHLLDLAGFKRSIKSSLTCLLETPGCMQPASKPWGEEQDGLDQRAKLDRAFMASREITAERAGRGVGALGWRVVTCQQQRLTPRYSQTPPPRGCSTELGAEGTSCQLGLSSGGVWGSAAR